ncbi:MAG: UDP-3-O-(3-hydroxymyristoyl)glucosamine N-acyltransferase [Acidobacteriales bacterium]|nr:UDP-3-O-(3-hydroxymyristoyl)glucosamine N-acyltransferase [Terriglobales bacterium]
MKLRGLAQAIDAQLLGDETVEVGRVSGIGAAAPGDLVFVEESANLSAALASGASAVIAGTFAAQAKSSKPLLISTQPRLAFAHAAKLFSPPSQIGGGVHPSAVIHPSARIDPSATIEAHVVVASGAEVGGKTILGAGCIIGENARLGSDCHLYSNVVVYSGMRIGDRVIVHAGAILGSDGFGYVRDQNTGRYENFPQVGSLEIEDDVEIGANTTIDRGALELTRIGRGTKIDNLVHIGHNCEIGEDVVIAAQTGLSGSIRIGKNVLLGGQVGIGEHAHIEEGVMLGGQAGVLPNKVLRGKGIAFWGTPAQPVREYLKGLAMLARLARKK